ncbi:MAG: hypothetical protein ACPG77_13075, partial [Nannocystaceae bacterium]
PAGEPAAPADSAAPTGPRGPAAADGVVGLMRFGGDPAGNDLRAAIQQSFEAESFTVKGVALDLETAAKKVKCRGEIDDACVGKIGQWLNKKGKTQPPYTYLIYGTYGSGDEGKVTSVVVYDLTNNVRVQEIYATYSSDDFIIPLMLPKEVVAKVKTHIEPLPPISAEEQKLIDEVDGGLTPEDIEAQKAAEAQAEADIASRPTGPIDTSGIKVDLKKDHKKYCRNEKRKKRKSKDDPKDLRPSCKLGPTFGYWQTRSWVALGLTTGALAASGILYIAGLAKRGSYKTAVSDLEAAALDPTIPANSQAYTDLGSDVAAKGGAMRKMLVGGDIALATGVVLGGVLAVIIYQDRSEAKAWIKEEKALAGIRNLRVSPMIGKGFQGASLGFHF